MSATYVDVRGVTATSIAVGMVREARPFACTPIADDCFRFTVPPEHGDRLYELRRLAYPLDGARSLRGV